MAAIDIVYLWVNGADPAWQARRSAAWSAWLAANPAMLARYGNVAGRYRDNGELRYSLRTLERFYPDHGHVYLVTDAQRPDWLREHPQLTVIDHADLIPAGRRPVFDAGNIESYIHHIPGLSERFIYCNDDVFFGAPFDADSLFGPPGLVVYREVAMVPDYMALQPDETALVNAAVLSRQWLSMQLPGYTHVAAAYAHIPRGLLRNTLFQLEEQAADLFARVRGTTFRSWQTPPVLTDLYLRWMAASGQAAERVIEPCYLSTGDADAAAQFARLEAGFGHIPFFCINDTSDDAPDDDPALLRVATTLRRLLPQPSRFER
ncbi:Exopolysaccharide phosphotransferase CpsY [Andreprevotia sp. IGB-42]|uniref:stealth family protein n=1 Tax=Andreprevotia sp. IGB-42 TaxID=2497473 RepID=UPI00157EF5FA|nr:stealth family protein [Andreprevotia sp. IGB-42]KAF0811615.1 Exopolysaccharide phosphotransferase CpsY [Andreprevotia sp. IGB-42]